MSKIREVLKNKNRVEKAQRARRKEEINSLQSISTFRASLYDELKKVDILLEHKEIDAIMITVPNEFLAKFGEAVYSEDLAAYDIEQVEDSANQFYIRQKVIQF